MSSNLKEVLQQNNFRFNKAFGQNFISDTNLLSAIVEDAGILEGDTVVEIGAGGGTLTESIARKAKRVISYEIDKNLVPVLQARLGAFDNVEMRFEDIMKADTTDLSELESFHVIANLPYYITTPVVMLFLEKFENAKSITVMVQKEVAERFSSLAGSEEYGAITAVIDFYGEAKITRIVGKNMFYPVPKVDSAVLNIVRRKKYHPKSTDIFLKTVKASFAMRRKTLSNNLMNAFLLPRAKIDELITAAGFSPSVRGERLTTADFVKLSDAFCEE